MGEVTKKRVGVLRGGIAEDYMPSLRRGGEIISHIMENLGEKYKVVDILVDRDGVWHLGGVPVLSSDLVHKVDVVWNATHPSFSNILQSMGIPYVGHGTFAHTLERSKEMLREHMAQIGVGMPRHIVIPVYQRDFDGPREKYAIKKAKEVHEKFGAPWIVTSYTTDANMGIHLAKTFPELVGAIEDGTKHEKSILVEEFISGKVAAVHSVPHFRGEEVYTFPLGNTFGRFSSEEKDKISNLAKDLHRHLGANHYLQLNFVMTPRGKVYLTHFESTPDFKPGSHLTEVCESVGAKMHHVVEHILNEAIK
jgi:D-alanine-D-alanine ligase-like ATP-grasp enzyme